MRTRKIQNSYFDRLMRKNNDIPSDQGTNLIKIILDMSLKCNKKLWSA